MSRIYVSSCRSFDQNLPLPAWLWAVPDRFEAEDTVYSRFGQKQVRNVGLGHLRPELCRRVAVEKVRFNYRTETWENDWYNLPVYNGDYVILTPKDMLTKEDIWISRYDMQCQFHEVAKSLSNEQLRALVNNYFLTILSSNPTKDEMSQAAMQVYRQFPELIEYYIRYKEDQGDLAKTLSEEKVRVTDLLTALNSRGLRLLT